MRQHIYSPEALSGIVENLPAITDHLITIRDLESGDVTLKTRDYSDNCKGLTATDLQPLRWPRDVAKNLDPCEPNESGQRMNRAIMLALNGLVKVSSMPEEAITSYRHGELPEVLLFSAQSIVEHTPYPFAFVTRTYQIPNKPSLQQHIRDHSESYRFLGAIMTFRQQKLVGRALRQV